MTGPDPRGIYFDSNRLGEPQFCYVLWLDVMGSANQMVRSLPISANFIFKLHCAVLEAFEEGGSPTSIRLYPVMDGAYVTSERRAPLQGLINQALRRVVTTFMNEQKPYHQFLVRGALSYGPVYHGSTLEHDAARVLGRHSDIRNSILMGLPMAQAYNAERDGAPFGVAVHSSARAFAPLGDEPFRFIWLDWFRAAQPPIDAKALLAHLAKYFEWQTHHYNMTGYKPDRIAHHRQLAKEYFTSG